MGIGFDSLGFNFSACARTRTHLRGIERWVGIGLARGGTITIWGMGYHADDDSQEPSGTSRKPYIYM